jgi:hypothetical protein
MRLDSVLEIVLNDFSQNIILSIVDISLIEYVVHVFIEKFLIRSSEIQFIFEENFRVEVDTIVVLGEMKRFE